MLLSYWRSYSEAGRVIPCAGILAVAIAIGVVEPHLIGAPWASNKQQQAQSDKPPMQWAPHLSTDNRKQGPGKYQADCTTPQNREEADLCQQWRVAKATEEAVALADAQWWLSVWQLAVGVVGTGVVTLALIYTRKATEAAVKAAEAAQRSVDTQVRLEQPLLRVSRIATPFDDENPYQAIIFEVENLGKTPAVLLRWTASCEAIPSVPVKPEYDVINEVRGTIVRQDEPIKHLTAFLSDASDDAVRSRTHALFFWGYFEYEDVFGRTRRTGFAYRGERNALIPMLSWNRVGGSAYNYDREETAES